jgi:competence protein ComEC
LLVEYLGRRILLTGDLEGAGLRRLLATEPLSLDVLIAPHHGSRRANTPELVAWAQPKLVIVSQGKPRSGASLDAFHRAGVRVMSTNEYGAITVRIDSRGLEVRTIRPGDSDSTE